MTERTGRLTELDGLRGLAALGVALFHLRIFLAGEANPLLAFPGSEWILTKGWHLVDLFFVLSGFIFSHCYLREGRMRPGIGAGDFLWARFARLWPLHAVLLCFAGFVLFRDDGTNVINFVTSLAMMHAFLPDIDVLNPPAWSLSVECLCYALFAVLAMRAGRDGVTLGSLAIAALGAVLIVTDTMPDVGRGLYGFFIGCLVHRYRTPLDRLPAIALGALLALPLVLGTERHFIIAESALSWPAAILLAARVRWLKATPFQWLGSRSYALYLSHVPLYIVLGNVWMSAPAIPAAAAVALCLAMVLVVSDILYRRLEMPAQACLLEWRMAKRQHALPLSS